MSQVQPMLPSWTEYWHHFPSGAMLNITISSNQCPSNSTAYTDRICSGISSQHRTDVTSWVSQVKWNSR